MMYINNHRINLMYVVDPSNELCKFTNPSGLTKYIYLYQIDIKEKENHHVPFSFEDSLIKIEYYYF